MREIIEGEATQVDGIGSEFFDRYELTEIVQAPRLPLYALPHEPCDVARLLPLVRDRLS